MRLKWMAIAAPLLALLLAGSVAEAQHEGHMGMAAAVPPGDPDVLYNAEDMQFLHHMAMHHQQALDMSALVNERASHAEFKKFARYVSRGQAVEIQAMHALEKLGKDRGISAPMGHMDHDPPMAGMLPKAEMAALEASTGDAFERRWMQGMIFHHEGGLAMARAQQLQQLEHGRSPYGLSVLVEDILIEQRAEVVKMYHWLADWGLTPTDDRSDARDPASEVVSPVPMAVLPAGQQAELIGLAVDDRGIAKVQIAIQNLDDKNWWREGDAWSKDRALHTAELDISGFSSVAWTYGWTPPAPGRYAITVLAEDTAGKTAESDMMRQFRVK